MQRAVIYARVSSDPNDRGRSVEEQEAECRTVCERNGWEVVDVFRDNDRSASRYATKDRPSYRDLIEFIDAGKADVLVTWESSRSSRDLAEYVRLRDLFERHGVLLSYSGRVFDMAEADDRFQTGLDFLLSERESDQTRKRVLRAVRSNAEKGRPHGRPLYGYRREYDGRGELVAQVPDEATAPVVREAARRVLAGETPFAVALDFDRRGIPTPRNGARWDLTMIKRLCINPGYAGKRVHQGRVVGDAAWPAIISEGDHLALVAKLGDPRRRSQRDSSVKHLLSGIAVCGTCGGRMRGQKTRGVPAYACVHGYHIQRNEADVDAYVTEVVLQRLERPDLADLLAAGTDDEETTAALAEATEKRARLETFYDEAAAGNLTAAALARVEARLLPEIEAAEGRAQAQVTSPLVAEVAGSEARERWETLSITQRREVISTLMSVRILPIGHGTRTFRPETVEIVWR